MQEKVEDYYRELGVVEDDLTTLHNRATALSNKGDRLKAQGSLTAALDAYRAGLAIRKRLAEQDPSNANWQRDLWVSHVMIGDVQQAQRNLTAALEAYRACLAIAKRLVDQYPDNAGWQRDRWISCWDIANVMEQAGDAEAREWWKRTYAIMAELKSNGASLSPEDEEVLQSLREKLDTGDGLRLGPQE